MAMKRVFVSLLAAALAVMVVFGVSILDQQVAEAAPATTVKTCGGDTIKLSASEKRVLDLHHNARKRRELKPLCVHPILTQAARAHTKEMLDRQYFSHDSFNGETLRERLERFGYTSSGYTYYYVGENISWGCGSYGTPDKTFERWMHSTVHRENILWSRFRQVGIGVLTGTYKNCSQVTMYTVDFGTRRR
jgi:uncharacterized protein YkwD